MGLTPVNLSDGRSHTSCISEAEKYQGALYKGPKKDAPVTQFNQPTAPAATPVTETPVPAIHPSRMNLVDNPVASRQFTPRFQAGPAPVKARGPKMSGENKRAPEGGMRSWGSPAVIEEPVFPEAAAARSAIPNPTVVGEKKKRKKGDKGGTGSKANSKQKEEQSKEEHAEPVEKDEPPAKRHRAEPTEDKTLKRLRKNAAKMEQDASLNLAEWLERVGKKVEGDVNQAAKVAFENGKWVLSF